MHIGHWNILEAFVMASVSLAVEQNNSRVLRLVVAVPGSVPGHDLDLGVIKATSLGHTDCLRILLQAGASADHQDSQGNTLLRGPAEKGNVDTLEALIEAGCSVNTSNHHGATALHHAARYGREESVSLLLSHGARILQDSSGCTPLILAAKNCHRSIKVMKILIAAECDLDVRDENGKTALHYCAQQAIGVDLLLAAGANPDLVDDNGNSPMMLAAAEGFDNIIKSLVSYGADPGQVNGSRMAPIHLLAMKNHWRAIEAIARVHGNVDMLDGRDNIPLWYAVNHNRLKAVRSLLQANCNPDPPRGPGGVPIGGVPLKTALEKKLYVIAKLLVLSGCNLEPLYPWLAAIEERKNQVTDSHFVFAEESDSEDEDEEETEAVDWFDEWVHSPHSLRQICRIWIRQYLGRGLINKGQSLPIPPSIRDYITLNEVHDHHVVSLLL